MTEGNDLFTTLALSGIKNARCDLLKVVRLFAKASPAHRPCVSAADKQLTLEAALEAAKRAGKRLERGL